MIIYRAETCPDWLVGARDLCERQGLSCRYFGIGDPVLFTPPAEGWIDLGDGVEVAVCGEPLDHAIVREVHGMRLDVAANASGARMAVPVVLTKDGTRAFVAPIGEDYLPQLTDEQQRLMDIAEAARVEMARAADGDGGVDAASAGRWCVELLCAANHISEGALLKLGLVDEGMIVEALTKAVCCG